LLKYVLENGKKWSVIAIMIEGRTENNVKNRFKSLMHHIYKGNE